MFALKSRYLRRRLSPPTSGSLRRRARERRVAQQTRTEGELLAKTKREQRVRDKLEQQRQAREELASYEPWGRAGGGAPNPRGVRYVDLRAGGLYPENELKGMSQYEGCRRWSLRRRRAPLRLREDPQLCYAEGLRKSVDNDIRYRQNPDQQKNYKQILDDMVSTRKEAERNEIKQDLECERKIQAMEGPWGKPGPGGTTWRNPRDVGLNFSKSMGWTGNEIFSKIKEDHNRHKRSSLSLPPVKRDDDTSANMKAKLSGVEKLPDINAKYSSEEEKQTITSNGSKEMKLNENVKSRKTKKHKFVKRFSNGDRVARVVPFIEDDMGHGDESSVIEKKPTPEKAILRLTGGIELVPLLARQRRVGARTLPSSDVTRPQEENCQWREILNVDYLRELKNQIRVKTELKEECRRDSAESCRQHHATWAGLWGRPGHGAPLRGRYARSNLAHLLYVEPLAPVPPAL